MAKLFENVYLASLGFAFLTYEKAEKLTQNLIEKGELAKERQKEFIQELMDKAKANTNEPVSYTHLDVYKRQLSGKREHRG